MGERFVNTSLTPPAIRVTAPTVRSAIACLEDPGTKSQFNLRNFGGIFTHSLFRSR